MNYERKGVNQMPKYIGGNYYPYQPYSFWRIKEVMSKDYGLELVNNSGYKQCRYGKKNTYNLVDQETKKIVLNDVTLDGLRVHLANNSYPLKDNE